MVCKRVIVERECENGRVIGQQSDVMGEIKDSEGIENLKVSMERLLLC